MLACARSPLAAMAAFEVKPALATSAWLWMAICSIDILASAVARIAAIAIWLAWLCLPFSMTAAPETTQAATCLLAPESHVVPDRAVNTLAVAVGVEFDSFDLKLRLINIPQEGDALLCRGFGIRFG